MTMRVLIVASDAVAAEAIRRRIRHTSHCVALGFVRYDGADEIPTGEDAPDVVLIDDNANDRQLFASVPGIRRAAGDSRLVLLTSRNGRGWLEAPWASAIDAVVSRIVDPAVLGMLLHEIAAGRIFHVASHAAPASPTSHISLTGRELEILRLVASGSSNADIGTRLWVTEQTVKFHLSNVYRKLGVANRTQASHYAHVHGLLDRPRSLGSLAVPKAA